MSAAETARRVIDWAISGIGPLPRGDLRDADDLAAPPPPLREAAQRLVGATAARLRWGHPPLGDARPMSVGAIALAAILGASEPDRAKLAEALLPILPESDAMAGYLGRYGLLAPALPHLPESMADECRSRCPLTAVLERPAPRQESRAVVMAQRILGDARGRASLQFHLARPTDDARVRRWRADLLDRLRLVDEPGRRFVLDVYEATMIHHRPAALEQIRKAGEVMRDRLASRDEASLRDAMAVAEWWGPLWAIHRQDIDALRGRPYLHYDFMEGLRLYQLRRRMTGGIA
jgi:hypothetical protein